MTSSQFAAWAGLPNDPEALSAWAMTELQIAGEVAGVAATLGTEIHFALSPVWKHRAINRRTTRSFLAPLMARRGYLTTRASDASPEQLAFIRRLGFVPTWTDGTTEHFILTALPFSKGG